MEIKVVRNWGEIFEGKAKEQLETEVLPSYMVKCRWFGGKARQLHRARLIDAVPVGVDASLAQILLLGMEYAEGLSDMYILPVAFAEGSRQRTIALEHPHSVISQISFDGREGILYDGIYDEAFCKELLSMIAGGSIIRACNGEFLAYAGKGIKEAEGKLDQLRPRVLKAEQSNTSALFGEELFLKIYRHPEEGHNPDLEITRFLTERAGFPNVPSFAGGMEYRRVGSAEPVVVGILQGFIPNRGDALSFCLDILNRYYAKLLARGRPGAPPSAPASLFEVAMPGIHSSFEELTSKELVQLAGLLGKRTAELHLCLSSENDDPDFRPESFSNAWRQTVSQSMQNLAEKVLDLLRISLAKLPADVGKEAADILGSEKMIFERMRAILKGELSSKRIRVHGDYHLGQVLFTGEDFFIIDFEGEPARTIKERRHKKSPLVDVAGMIRSFHYAAYLALIKGDSVPPEEAAHIEPWAEWWYRFASRVFLQSYLNTMGDSDVIPRDGHELEAMLKAFLLDKAVYELGYELNNRPEWVLIPIRGIRQLLGSR